MSPDSPLASGVEWKICEDILKDSQLAAAVDIVGYVIEPCTHSKNFEFVIVEVMVYLELLVLENL